MELGMYIMTPKSISAAHFMNPSISLCLYMYLHIVARQRVGKNVTAAKNIHETIEELFDASFSMRFVS
jgi:hypothetical protein